MAFAPSGSRSSPGTPLASTARRDLRANSHLTILRPGAAFARSPARTEDVGGFAVHAVGGTHYQTVTVALVDTGGTHVRVELGDLGRDVGADDEMRGNVVAGRVTGLEDRIELAEGELTIRHKRLGRRHIAHDLGILVRVDSPAAQ